MNSNAAMRVVVGAMCLLQFVSCASRSSHATAQALPLSVCEVFASSPQRRNTIVTVRGHVVRGFEIFVLVSDECPTEDGRSSTIWLDVPRSDDHPYAEGVGAKQFIAAVTEKRLQALSDSLTWYTPVPVQFEDTSASKRLRRALRRGKPVTATITGRLDYSDGPLLRRLPDGSIAFSGGFGHLNGYSRQLIIQRIENLR